jgi:hypothetical protein
VFFALFAPVMVAFLIFVIDVDNWYEHQRHLQVQADSAALGAATAFQPSGCSDGTIYATAGQYGGASSVTGPGGQVASTTPLYNGQVGNSSQTNLHELVNSKTFYNQSSTSLPQTPDDTNTSAPCETPSGQVPMIDVKMTETNLPWFFNPLKLVPFINAQARVSFLQESTSFGAEALAVADSAPVAAEAYFVNEDVSPGSSGWILASTKLCKQQDAASNGDQVWDNSGGAGGSTYADPSCQGGGAPGPLPVQINKPHVGVVIALSGNKNDVTCGDPYVECFDDTQSGGNGPSLLHIQGYSLGGSGTIQTPRARQVTITSPPGSCTDGYFSNSTTNCTATINAKIDYGSTNRKGVTVTPVVSAGGGKGVNESPLTFNSTSGQWTGTISLQGAGSNQIDLDVHCTKNQSGPCGSSTTDAAITDVQRSSAASTNTSGTIDGAWISEVGSGGSIIQSQDADSFEVCESQDNNSCTHNLVVTVDVGSSLQNTTSFSAPPYAIKLGTSQSDVVECPPYPTSSGYDYRNGIANGCPQQFTINNSDSNCAQAQANTSPYDCIELASGIKEGPTSQGICTRITLQNCGAGLTPPAGLRYYCPNNWVNNNNGGVPVIPANDSRLVTLFVMPYGSTTASGQPQASGFVPIVDFAEFYVTGFDGDPCSSDNGAPPGASGNGWIVGHFIKYVQPPGTGSGSGACVVSSFGNCVGVLTK